MSQAVIPHPKPVLPASVKETIAWLREEATKQFINGDVRGSDYRRALAADLERSTRERSPDHE